MECRLFSNEVIEWRCHLLRCMSLFVGTFRKCRNVQLESGMRTKADVPRPP
jgi:hypothetical protein